MINKKSKRKFQLYMIIIIFVVILVGLILLLFGNKFLLFVNMIILAILFFIKLGVDWFL